MDNVDSQQNQASRKKPKKPAGPIRTAGIATLIITAGSLAALGYFAAEPFTKSALTLGLEEAFGAEANVDDVALTLQPFGISVSGIQQTDPDNPNKNIFELKTLSAKVDFWELLLGKVIIDDLTASGLAFKTPRATAGAVFPKESDEDLGDKAEAVVEELVGGIEVPTSKELLAKADLLTEKKAKNLKEVWDKENTQLKASIDNLPNKDTLKKYEEQWKEIENTKIKSPEDIEVLKAKIDALKMAIKKDKEAIAAIKSQYKSSKEKVETAYKELKAAPAQDWQNIKKTLPIDDPNAIAISKLIFGDEVTQYLVKAEEYYQVVKPFIDARKEAKAEEALNERKAAEGEFVEFPLDDIWPSWMVKNLKVTVSGTKQQSFALTGNEITNENYVREKPSQYQIDLVSTIKGESFTLMGDYFFVESGNVTTKGSWQADGLKMVEKELISSDDLTVNMGDSVIKGKGRYQWQQSLESKHDLAFSNVVFSGSASTNLAELTLDTLKNVSQFGLEVSLDGSLSSPDIAIKSDLDNQLNTAFKKQVKQRWAKLKTETQEKLKQKLQSELNLNSKDLQKFEALKAQYENADESLQKFAEDKLNALIDEKKKELKDKLKKKAEDKLKEKLKEKLKDFGF